MLALQVTVPGSTPSASAEQGLVVHGRRGDQEPGVEDVTRWRAVRVREPLDEGHLGAHPRDQEVALDVARRSQPHPPRRHDLLGQGQVLDEGEKGRSGSVARRASLVNVHAPMHRPGSGEHLGHILCVDTERGLIPATPSMANDLLRDTPGARADRPTCRAPFALAAPLINGGGREGGNPPA